MQLVVDWSRASGSTGLHPYKGAAVCNFYVRILEKFIEDFIDHNPLSQLGIILMKDGTAQCISNISSSPDTHSHCIKKLSNEIYSSWRSPSGSASFQNALDEIINCIQVTPVYGHREAIFIISSLSSCDPENIMNSIERAQQSFLHVNFVSLSAEIYVCKLITEQTDGWHSIALHERHLTDLLRAHIPSSSLLNREGAFLMSVGFTPRRKAFLISKIDILRWSDLFEQKFPKALQGDGYICSRCNTTVCKLPAKCPRCRLFLINNQHLTRSFYNIFTVTPFDEIPLKYLEKELVQVD